jgi:DNA sulfur modification protein DndD
MKLQLAGIKAIGLRCAELDLRFGNGSVPQFTFIQMPNGTGKTTLAECLRAALSGEASSWDAERVRSFQRVTGSDAGLFEARFSLDGSPMAIGMKFDFTADTISYYTTFGRGRLPKFSLPPVLARFADPGFVRLYIFDAELPQELLQGDSDRAEKAIDAFYQLYVLEEISNAIQRYWDGQVQGASTQQGLVRHKNRLTDLKERKKDREWALERNQAELRSVEEEREAKSVELDDHLGQVEQYRNQKALLEAQLKTARDQLVTALADALGRLRRPLDAHLGFRSALDSLTAGLDSLKLPEATSREFFRDLADQEYCICGSPMTASARENIARAAEHLLADDAAGVINALKNDARSFQRDEACPGLTLLANDLTAYVRKRDVVRHDLELLVSDASEKADEAARSLKEAVDQLDRNHGSLVLRINALTRDPRPDDDEHTTCIKWFDQEINRLDLIVAEAARLVELREHRDELRDVLASSARRAREEARKELVSAMNERLSILLPGEGLTVADIRPYLKLEGREGVNLGAMLSIGYSFLTTLFERGNHEFPFVVDAPTMGLDGLAREALANILPRAAHQFVGFVLDNERDFTRQVRENVPGSCEFYTVFSDSSRNRPLADQLPSGTEVGAGGTYVVRGFDFFDQVMWTRNGER